MESIIAITDKQKIDNIFNFLDVSESTREDYKYRIGLFIKHTQEYGINNNTFLEYKRILSNRNDLSVSTKNKYLASTRIFLKELNRQGLFPIDITQNIKSFKQGKKHKKDGFNDEEINMIVSAIHNKVNNPKNARLKAILSLLVLQGLRQCEIIRLDYQDIDFVSKVAFIRGKGRDDKEAIDLHPSTIKALKEYVNMCNVADGVLFPSQSNNNRGQRMTTRALRQIVKKFIINLGIEKSVHGFRHYFTTKLVKNYKGDLLQVAKYTRHASLEMLQVYNDNINNKADLPKYYKVFNDVNL